MTQTIPLPALETPTIRTYDVGVRFIDTNRTVRRQTEIKANAIIKELQMEAFSRITPVAVNQTMSMVRSNKKITGAMGVSKVTKITGDRDNLSQISYLHLLGKCETTIQTEQKAQLFIKLLQDHPREAGSWLVLGRQPYLELLLAKYYKINRRYARNLVHAFRRRLDRYLPEELQLNNITPVLEQQSIEKALVEHTESIQDQFAILPTLTPRQEQYQKKLSLWNQHSLEISQFITNYLQTEWYQPINPATKPRTFWRCLRLLSKELQKYIYIDLQLKTYRKQQSYLSVLRSIISSTLEPLVSSTVQTLLANETICPEHMVTPPYEKIRNKNTYYHRVPLHLITGSKYVIRRSGNKQIITKEAKELGYIPILIKANTRKIQWSKAITCHIVIHRKLRNFLIKGATINSIILYTGNAPSYKIRCQLIMEGTNDMFVSTNQILKQKDYLEQYYSSQQHSSVLGLDVNRISEYMLAFSEPVPLPATMLKMVDRYLTLGHSMKHQSYLVTNANHLRLRQPTLTNQQTYCKRLTELHAIQKRRKCLRAELHRSSSRFVSSVLLWSASECLAIESLDISTDHTKKALAKAITSMPDELALYLRSVMVAQTCTTKELSLVAVNPAFTSQSEHIGCSAIPAGRPKRTPDHYDIAPCSTCGTLLNTHTLSAQHIALRGLTLLASPS